jgi:flagellar basal-body rod protein FlgB
MFKNLLSESMNGALKTSEENHFSSSNIENGDNPDFEIVNIKNSGNVSGINNNVDIDKEMAELAKNSMNFAFASKKISDYYKTLQDVIKGGSTQ